MDYREIELPEELAERSAKSLDLPEDVGHGSWGAWWNPSPRRCKDTPGGPPRRGRPVTGLIRAGNTSMRTASWIL